LIEAFEASGDSDAIIVLDQPPTAEVMGLVLERRLEDALPDTVSDIVVEVRETDELAAGGTL
jgi:6-pyruvoyltetrahydropterin/6-carboxytetrahydropterin synthase